MGETNLAQINLLKQAQKAALFSSTLQTGKRLPAVLLYSVGRQTNGGLSELLRPPLKRVDLRTVETWWR
jgi:hypothetical protein